MAYGPCKLTGKHGAYIRAHIVPKGFYLLEGDLPTVALTNKPELKAKRIPIGIYDENLVVAESEIALSKLDDYAIKVLRPEPSPEHYFKVKGEVAIDRHDGLPLAYQLQGIDYERLKLFFMSVLWRAGATTRPEFNGLVLGPHLEQLRRHVASSQAPVREMYSVIIERYVEGQLVPVMPFFPDRIQGVNFQVALFGGFRIWIKCDRRATPAPFNSIQLSPDAPLTILLSRFKGSKVHESLSAIAKAHAAVHGDPWKGRAPKS